MLNRFPRSRYSGGGQAWGLRLFNPQSRSEIHNAEDPHPNPPPEYREREQGGGDALPCPHTSRFFTSSAWSSMNVRRRSTSSPINTLNIRSASVASWSVT